MGNTYIHSAVLWYWLSRFDLRLSRECFPKVGVPLQILVSIRLLHVNHVVAGQFLSGFQVRQGNNFRDPPEGGMLNGVPTTVGLEGVVDFVTKGSSVVVKVSVLGQKVQKFRGIELKKNRSTFTLKLAFVLFFKASHLVFWWSKKSRNECTLRTYLAVGNCLKKGDLERMRFVQSLKIDSLGENAVLNF